MSEVPHSYTQQPKIGYVTDDLRRRLHEIWKTEPGIFGWLGTVDHKTIGIRYLVTAFAFLIIGGLEALVMRVQLAQPEQSLLTPEQYNQLFSMHGITMIFLYALPVLSGFSNYLFPLLLGSRDMAFPRMNAFSYWIYLFSGIFIYSSFLVGEMPNDGWFNYAPYSLEQYNPGLNMDFYALGMIMFAISNTAGSINFIVTFLRTRAPGMSLNRVPVMLWGTTTVSVGSLLAFPAVSAAFFFLWMDRNFGTHFYETAGGGKPLLWQHLFWLFAHPWVYIIVLPAQGIVSDGLPTFCRQPLVGYTLVVIATITTMMLGFGVWMHHMFVTGVPWMSLGFFSGASFIITVPSAVQVFCWIATIWYGRPVIKPAFLYFAAFIVMFVIGGVSGVMTASVPADFQLHDTYFVVAHIHYVLIGINVFAVLGGLHFWFPKITGRMMHEGLAKLAFWLVFIGFNAAFLPMHWTGLMGMPRRIYTYPEGSGWDWMNLTTTVGAFVLALGILLVFANAVRSLRTGEQAGPNPWDGYSLEWATSSPPPHYNFAVQPVVASRHPLWEDRLHEGTGVSSIDRGPELDRGKQIMLTSALDAEPDLIAQMPGDSLWPLLTTLGISVLMVGLLLHWWWVAVGGAAIVGICMLGWLWPHPTLQQTARPQHD